AQSYPGHFKAEANDDRARVRVRDNSAETAKPDFKGHFGLDENIDLSDETAEEKLAPAARRYVAKSRHQLPSPMLLTGVNRCVVTSGRISAKMGFRIDAKDHGTAQSSSQFDWKNETTASAGGGLAGLFGGPSIETKNTVAYVSS